MPQRSRPGAVTGFRVLAVLVAASLAACAPVDDDLAEPLAAATADDGVTTLPLVTASPDGTTTTAAPSGNPSTSAPDTSEPPSTTGSPPTDPAGPDALALAAALEVGATQLQATLAANASLDPFAGIVDATRESATAYRAIPATDTTAAILDDLAGNADALADLVLRYEGSLTDPSTAPTATPDFLAENGRLTEDAVEIEGRLSTLVDAELIRLGGPAAEYFLATGAIQRNSGAAITDFLTALQLLTIDPVGALTAMRDPVETIGRLGPLVDEIEAPPALDDYHRRYVAFVGDYATTFGAVIDAAESGGGLGFTELRDVQALGALGPELNAERSRLTAAALRGELD